MCNSAEQVLLTALILLWFKNKYALLGKERLNFEYYFIYLKYLKIICISNTIVALFIYENPF